MVDVAKLRLALADYEQALNRHRIRLTDSYVEMEKRYAVLSSVYDGVAADEFKAGWTRTAAAFEAYLERLDRALPMLRERIDILAAVDRRGL